MDGGGPGRPGSAVPLSRGPKRPGLLLHLLPFLVLLLLFLGGCVLPPAWRPVPPVAKIGLVAPFEGVYRQTGYATLDGLRAAIGTAPAGSPAFLPLALDSSGEPQAAARATAKALVDPTVRALIGPMRPDTATEAAPALIAAPRRWLLPYRLPFPPRPEDPDPGWAVSWVEAVLARAQAEGASGLVLAGWIPGWPRWSDGEWQAAVGGPVWTSDRPQDVAPGQAVLWLGTGEEAVPYLEALWGRQPGTPVWLTPWSADPVLVQRLQASQVAWEALRWGGWLGPDFPEWRAAHPGQSPLGYLTYWAGLAAMAHLRGTPPPDFSAWSFQFYPLERPR